jgi:probable HAF family extracellular repeat protein
LSTDRLRAALPLVLALVLAVSPPAAALETYLEKVPLPGGEGFAFDINDDGRVVGLAGAGATGTAFLHENGTTTLIGPAGWGASLAMRVSANGTIVGFGEDGGTTKGFLRSGGVTTELMPPGWTSAQPMGVNDGGAVVGFGIVGGSERAFGYSSGFYVDFLPPGFTESRAIDVNNNGHVVGSASTAAGKEAFLFIGAWRFPAPPGWTDTEAVRINERGDILGNGTDGTRTKCFLLKDGAHTVIYDARSPFNLCFDMNDRGDVTGIGFDPAGGVSTFVYRDGEYHFLDRRIITFFGAAAINNARQLAGGVEIDGVDRAVIASILPEARLLAKGSEGPVAAPRSAPPPVTLSLTSWTLKGRLCDWWFFVQTPAGIYSFDVASRSWLPGFFPSAKAPLRDLAPRTLPPAAHGAGPYTYYFGVDFLPNGVMDARYFVFGDLNVFLQ